VKEAQEDMHNLNNDIFNAKISDDITEIIFIFSLVILFYHSVKHKKMNEYLMSYKIFNFAALK